MSTLWLLFLNLIFNFLKDGRETYELTWQYFTDEVMLFWSLYDAGHKA